MLSLLVSLAVLGGAPRGLSIKDNADLVTQVDTRLPKWLVLGGDHKALRASKQELTAYAESLPVVPADRKNIIKAMIEEQTLKPELTTFVPEKALVSVTSQVSLAFFDAQNRRCSMAFTTTTGGKAGGRLVLIGGPLTDDRTLEAELDTAKMVEAKVELFEKKDGVWAPMAIPAPPPPSCTDELKKAAKAVFIAEKSYFAEFDAYSNDLAKIGVDVKALGASAVKVELKGTGATASFTAEISLKGGVARVDDSSGQPTIVKPCTP